MSKASISLNQLPKGMKTLAVSESWRSGDSACEKFDGFIYLSAVMRDASVVGNRVNM